MALTQAGRGKVLAAIVAVFLVGGLLWSQLSDRKADAAGNDLRRDLVEAYRGTTIDDVGLVGYGDTFLARSGHSPTVATRERAGYEVEWFTESRCVVVHWDADGVDISEPTRCL